MDAAPTVLAAFGAGVLSAVSPAVVPLLPGLNGFVWHRGTLQTAAVLLGFSLVFIGLGAGATAVGQALLAHLTLCERLAGAFLVLLGLREMGLMPSERARARAGAPEPVTVLTVTTAVAAGASLSFGWTPLAGVVLNQILAIATSADTVDRGVALLTVYATGRALPLIGLALLINTFDGARIQLIAGAAVTLTGALIFMDLFPRIAAALVPFLPLA